MTNLDRRYLVDLLVLGLCVLGTLVCLSSGTGFDIFGTSRHVTTLVFPLVYVMFVATRFWFLIPGGREPSFRLTRNLDAFRDSSTAEILRLDAQLLRAGLLVVVTLIVYANVRVRLPILRESTYDENIQHLEALLLLDHFSSWLQQMTATHLPIAAGFVLVLVISGLLAVCFVFGVYVRRDESSMRRLASAVCLVVISAMVLMVLVPSLGPAFAEPQRFEWLLGTDFGAYHQALIEVKAHVEQQGPAGEQLRAHPALGIASFPALLPALMAVFATLSSHNRQRIWAATFAILAALGGLAGIAFGLHYLTDVIAGLLLGVVVTKGLLRWSASRPGTEASSEAGRAFAPARLLRAARKFIETRPAVLFYGVSVFLALSIVAIYFIDVHNAFALRDRWFTDREASFFFAYWFFRPVERPMQWMAIFGMMYVFFLNARRSASNDDARPFHFWRLMGIGAFLMFLEDVFDVRHAFRNAIAEMAGSGPYGAMASLFELSYFAALGGILVYAAIRYRNVYWNLTGVRRYLGLGYGFYGLAVVSSWLGTAFEWHLYHRIGTRLSHFLFQFNSEAATLFNETNEHLAETEREFLHFVLMDSVYEESLELLGATALVVAGLAFYFQTATEDDS